MLITNYEIRNPNDFRRSLINYLTHYSNSEIGIRNYLCLIYPFFPA